MRVFTDVEIYEALTHGPCFGCERCYNSYRIPREQIDEYLRKAFAEASV